jgi:hypothetical protein
MNVILEIGSDSFDCELVAGNLLLDKTTKGILIDGKLRLVLTVEEAVANHGRIIIEKKDQLNPYQIKSIATVID